MPLQGSTCLLSVVLQYGLSCVLGLDVPLGLQCFRHTFSESWESNQSGKGGEQVSDGSAPLFTSILAGIGRGETSQHRTQGSA
jgi:hypothetical protein